VHVSDDEHVIPENIKKYINLIFHKIKKKFIQLGIKLLHFVHYSPIAISSVKQAVAQFDIFADVMTLVPKVIFFFLIFYVFNL